MMIEVGSPVSLPLGLVKFENEAGTKLCLLGITLQHPPIQIFGQASSSLQITGPRAHAGHAAAEQFLQHHQLPATGELEIESTIPSLVGLGTDALQAMSVAQAYAWIHNLPEEQQGAVALSEALALDKVRYALDIRSFEKGGLLLIDLDSTEENGIPSVIRRKEIEHKEKYAWPFVILFPDDTENLPESYEDDQWANLLKAAPHLSSETGRLFDEVLWPAVENDDFAGFATSLRQLHELNEAALADTGTPVQFRDEDEALFDVIKAADAVAWGKHLTGYAYYGVIKGGHASRELRKAIREHVGFFGGTLIATITDNRGSVYKVDKQKGLIKVKEWQQVSQG